MPMIDMLKGKVTRQDWLFVGVVLTITVVLFVAFYFAVYVRQQDTIQAQQEHLQAVNQELEKAREINRGIEALRTEAAEMSYLIEVFEKRLPDEREIPALLSRFERLGNEIGLRVQLVSLPTRITPRMEVIPYRVTARGQFHQIATFINMLERDERYIKISDIDIGEEQAGVSQAVFILSTFRFIQPDSDGEE